MAQQVIDIGSAPNDGTGDPLRTAFDKINDNFTELYAAESWQRRQPYFYTDFLQVQTVQGFFFGAAISGGAIVAGVGGIGVVTANHPGCVSPQSAAASNSGYRFITAGSMIQIGGGEQFDLVFRAPAAFTDRLWRFGFLDTTTEADCTDGCYFELSGSGAIVGKTASNSTRTTSSTVATLSVDTWYHARVAINDDASEVTFEVFSDAGTSLGSQTVTTNIPTSAGRQTGAGVVVVTTGSSAIDLIGLDYMSVKHTKALTRGALT